MTSEFVRTVAAQARTGDLARFRDPQFPVGAMEDQIVDAVGAGSAEFLDATHLATALLGDAIATNMFLLGYAWQKGLVPLVGGGHPDRAIELNGAAVGAQQGGLHVGPARGARSGRGAAPWPSPKGDLPEQPAAVGRASRR